jgi:hypothetical protein
VSERGPHLTRDECRARIVEGLSEFVDGLADEWIEVQALVEDYERQITELALGAGPQAGWRDIATAPKDGTMIMVSEPSMPIQRHRIVVWWVHRWLTVPGRITVRPTHWMPLPNPPSAAVASSSGQEKEK